MAARLQRAHFFCAALAALAVGCRDDPRAPARPHARSAPAVVHTPSSRRTTESDPALSEVESLRRGPRCHESARLAFRSGHLRLARTIARECGDDASTLLAWEASFALGEQDSDPRDVPLLRRRLLRPDADLSGVDLYALAHVAEREPPEWENPATRGPSAFSTSDFFRSRDPRRASIGCVWFAFAWRSRLGPWELLYRDQLPAWPREIAERSVACRVLAAAERPTPPTSAARLDAIASRLSPRWWPLAMTLRTVVGPALIGPDSDLRPPNCDRYAALGSIDPEWFARFPMVARIVSWSPLEACGDRVHQVVLRADQGGNQAALALDGEVRCNARAPSDVSFEFQDFVEHEAPECTAPSWSARYPGVYEQGSFPIVPRSLTADDRAHAQRLGALYATRLDGRPTQRDLPRAQNGAWRSELSAPRAYREMVMLEGDLAVPSLDASLSASVEVSAAVGPAARRLLTLTRAPTPEERAAALIEVEDDEVVRSLAVRVHPAALCGDVAEVLRALGEPSLTAVLAFADVAPLLHQRRREAFRWLRRSLGYGDVARSRSFDRARLSAALRRVEVAWGDIDSAWEGPPRPSSFMPGKRYSPSSGIPEAVIELLRDEAREGR